MKRIFISDCEGPISKNDNAFEMMSYFVPDGDKIFTVTSRYDDALADILKRAGYKAGDTLKLILPFLKAFEVTDRKMRDFSARNLTLVKNAGMMLQHMRQIAPSYIVSTSYEHYIRMLCEATGFLFKNAYCTKLRLDKYEMTLQEKTHVKELGQEIAHMSPFEIPPKAKSLQDLSEKARETIERLDEIYWDQIAEMQIGDVYAEINPVGGFEKADAVKDVVKVLNGTTADAMYVGDSITDEEALKLVKECGGLAVSFNGNQYAVNNSEIALMSDDSIITAIVADAFIKFGKNKALEAVAQWNDETLDQSRLNKTLLETFVKSHSQKLPKAKIITSENMEKLAEESCAFRKKVRGEKIARLG